MPLAVHVMDFVNRFGKFIFGTPCFAQNIYILVTFTGFYDIFKVRITGEVH